MAGWLNKITADPESYDAVGEAYAFFTAEHEEARSDLNVRGKRIYDVSGRIAGWAEYRYAQCKEIEAIIDLLLLRQKKATQAARKRYLEHYNRELNATTVEKYAEAEADVITIGELIISMRLLEEKFKGITKGIETLHHQLRILTELRKSAIEDATI